MVTLQYSLVQPALAQSDLTTVGQYMFWLRCLRNVASDGLAFEDPVNAGVCRGPAASLPRPHGRRPPRT